MYINTKHTMVQSISHQVPISQQAAVRQSANSAPVKRHQWGAHELCGDNLKLVYSGHNYCAIIQNSEPKQRQTIIASGEGYSFIIR